MALDDPEFQRRKRMTWQTVIGLEVHAQLSTASKLFSTAPALFGSIPNTQTNFVDAGLPGVLPVLNRRAVQMAIQFGLAVNATINNPCYFERKNYFYPDLPKGYQISQFQCPIVSNGQLDIALGNGLTKTIQIDRAHLEEDAGKSLHGAHDQYSGIDLNRAGTPLLEIVTTPCLYSAEEVISYLKALHQLVRFLGICDGNMQEGSFRCDVNLSLRQQGQTQLGTRTELKNLNSFRFIEKAILFEQLRHQDILESGGRIIQETRLYNPDKNQTELMRSKENENDYRYFPDPDLLPVFIEAAEMQHLKQALPELPANIIKRLKNDDLLTDPQIEFIISSPAIAAFYKQIKEKSTASTKIIANWLKGTYAEALNELGLNFDTPPISSESLAILLQHLSDNRLSNAQAKKIFQQLLAGEKNSEALIAAEQNSQLNDTAQLDDIIRSVIQEHPEQVLDYRNGKEKLLGFLVGLVMKKTKGQADPSVVNARLIQLLNSSAD
jgi:aspartyl-tRNA(Asn)/glutamyl-tRNA(Gln) amidotransferase subunit B